MEDPRVGLVLDHRYRIEGRLAAGGMGVVYRAQRLGLAKPVAIKFLHASLATVPGDRLRFEREAAAMSRLTHPNLATVIDYGSLDDVPYLVMEFHVGPSLRELCAEGVVAPSRAVFIARQILAGLASAHSSGVIHRDLKPANILLTGNPEEEFVKILDFGVAKLLEGGAATEVSVVAGKVLGTPGYMSPEQATGQRVDARSDLYSVGIVLYEMVTGRRAFQAEGGFALLRKQVEEDPIRPIQLNPNISSELDGAIWRALKKDPEQRWQSAGDFGRALADVPEGRSGPPAAMPRGQRRRTAAGTEPPPTIEAIPIARPSGRRNGSGRTILLFLLLIAAASAAWFADRQGWIELPWPSWVPWAGG